MTVEPSWRIVSDACLPPHMGHVCPPGSYLCEDCGAELREEWLVPDTRLQDIADAWNRYETKYRTDPLSRDVGTLFDNVTALLDALTKENSDE